MKLFRTFFMMGFPLTIFLQIGNPPVRIMPMGDSITFDFNSGDQVSPRPDGDRISYRYKLYQLLTASGYSFDYVGSENSGNNYFQNDEMDDNAGFPNLQDDQLNLLINTGYNQAASQYEAPGPYLSLYPTDIILLHIGTNALDSSPADVEDLLNSIRNWEPNVIILVARIINRASYSSVTTDFNNNVEAMVIARNDPKIKMVDMENGAGINYSTDMYDNLHPNQNGYNKMAIKWFDAIDHLNTPPIITTIPEQTTTQGAAFPDLGLDAFVSDAEDSDNLIHWTFEQQSGSKYNVTLNSNRVLQVAANDPNWYGSETITLHAEDSGNGAFKKSATTSVVYTVLKANEAPVITSSPITSTNEDTNYSYTVIAQDNDGNTITYSAPQIPVWLNFSPSTYTLSGRPTNDNVGTYQITLRVSDGFDFSEQNFQLTVVNVNDLPVITSNPVTEVHTNETYTYELKASDIDAGDVLTYSVLSKPDWLAFSSGSGGGLLFGVPVLANVGSNGIVLKVTDGHADVLQGFTLTVIGPSAIFDGQEKGFALYPNPARDITSLKVTGTSNIRFILYDVTGNIQLEQTADDTDELQINLSMLQEGIYFYKAFINNSIVTGKLIKKD